MSKIKDVTVVTGTYTDKNGNQKRRYKTIGGIFETRNGQQLKLDTIPLVDGGWDGWAYLNDPKPREDRRQISDYDDSDF